MMSNNNSKKTKNNKVNPLVLTAVAVTLIAGAVVFFALAGKDPANTTSSSQIQTESSNYSSLGAISENNNGDVVIQIGDITENAAFYEYDSKGITLGLFAVKASDGTVRTALNTCQVCNGSPYAYFEQQENEFQCQNCGNLFSLDMIGQERGGCNPVPITDEEKTGNETEIIIPAKYFEDNADDFTNWKKF